LSGVFAQAADHFDGRLRFPSKFARGLKGVGLDAVAGSHERQDCAQNVAAAAPVLSQLGDVLAFASQARTVSVEYLRIGVAESVDGLIDIADGVEAVRGPQQVEQF